LFTCFLQTGKAYTVRQTTFQEYISDLYKRNKRGLTSYMAVQNISKTFPELQVSSYFHFIL